MIPLFTRANLMVLESLSFAKTLYAFDFDGTLCKIARTPAAARLSPKTASLLRELSALAPVAIISGRSVDDLVERLGFRPQYILGNHGIEGLREGAILVNAARICSGWKAQLRRLKYGTELEDKTYSLTIHYRQSRNKRLSREKIAEVLPKLTPTPYVIGGKSTVNLLPPEMPHKGVALLELLEKSGMRHIFYIGDDDTDEDIFSLPEKSGQIFTVRVGRKNKSYARHFIDRQSEINKLLGLMIGFYMPPKVQKIGHEQRRPPT